MWAKPKPNPTGFQPFRPQENLTGVWAGQAGRMGSRDPCPGGERTALAASGALTTLPMRLQSLELLLAVAGGSDGEATKGPSSRPLMPIDRGPRGVPPRLGTSIAVAAEQQPRLRGVAPAPQPRHQHQAGKLHAIARPAKGLRQPVPPHPPSPRVRRGPGSAHPHIHS